MMANLKKYFCFFLFLALIGCHGSKNDFSYKYKFTDVKIENAHTYGEYPAVSNLDSISKEAYAIQVVLSHEIIAEGHGYADSDHPPENLNPFDSLVISSNNDLSSTYTSGDNYNDNFMYFNGDFFRLKSIDKGRLTESENSYRKAITDTIHLLLYEPNVFSNPHSFKVDFHFHDGSVLSDSTEQIKLF